MRDPNPAAEFCAALALMFAFGIVFVALVVGLFQGLQ